MVVTIGIVQERTGILYVLEVHLCIPASDFSHKLKLCTSSEVASVADDTQSSGFLILFLNKRQQRNKSLAEISFRVTPAGTTDVVTNHVPEYGNRIGHEVGSHSDGNSVRRCDTAVVRLTGITYRGNSTQGYRHLSRNLL